METLFAPGIVQRLIDYYMPLIQGKPMNPKLKNDKHTAQSIKPIDNREGRVKLSVIHDCSDNQYCARSLDEFLEINEIEKIYDNKGNFKTEL